MSKVLAKVKDYAITEEMLNETVEALRTQQHINITSEEQKQDLLDELIARQLVVEDAIESGLTQTEANPYFNASEHKIPICFTPHSALKAV